jgi:hypothetical protein
MTLYSTSITSIDYIVAGLKSGDWLVRDKTLVPFLLFSDITYKQYTFLSREVVKWRVVHMSQ